MNCSNSIDTMLKEFWNIQLLAGPPQAIEVDFYQEENIHGFPLLCQDCHLNVEGYRLTMPDFPFVNPCWVFSNLFLVRPQLEHLPQFGVFQYKKYMDHCPAQSHRDSRNWSIFYMRRGWEVWDWSACSREGSGGILGGQTLEEATQTDRGISTLGDTQQSTRHSPGQPALSDPAFWGFMISRGSFQPKCLYVKKNFSRAGISSQKNWAKWLKTTINNNVIIDKNQVSFCTENSKLYKQKLIFLLSKYSPKYQGKKIKLLLLL